ncbi:MAG: hypothetical protein WBM41_04415 [Arenicellales bacterium]
MTIPSKWLLIGGTTVYLFAAAAIGIFLGIISRTMAQFALLMLLTIMLMMMLSGGMSPIESQPDIILLTVSDSATKTGKRPFVALSDRHP